MEIKNGVSILMIRLDDTILNDSVAPEVNEAAATTDLNMSVTDGLKN